MSHNDQPVTWEVDRLGPTWTIYPEEWEADDWADEIVVYKWERNNLGEKRIRSTATYRRVGA